MTRKTQAQRNCKKKIAYKNMRRAQEAIVHFLVHNGSRLRAYVCGVCGEIHLATEAP